MGPLSRQAVGYSAQERYQDRLIADAGLNYGQVSPEQLITMLQKGDDPTGRNKLAAHYLLISSAKIMSLEQKKWELLGLLEDADTAMYTWRGVCSLIWKLIKRSLGR
jgi:hypothetical protein